MGTFATKYDISKRDHYTISYWLPESAKYALRKIFFIPQPPGPLGKYLSDEEKERIVSKIVDLAMKEYTQDIYKSYNIRRFDSARDYAKFLADIGNERPIVSHNPRPYFKYGSHETEFIVKSIKKHSRNFIKHPEQYFENPKDIEKFLQFCRWQKDNPEYNVGIYAESRRFVKWEVTMHRKLSPEIIRGYTDYFDGNVIYHVINKYMKEIDSELYIRDITAANKLRPPEIDFSDSLTLSFYHLDFYKLIFEFNFVKNVPNWLFLMIKQINIRGFSPFNFFSPYFEMVHVFFITYIYPIYPFIVNNIYLIGGFGLFGLAVWIGLIIFIMRKYRFITYKDITK